MPALVTAERIAAQYGLDPTYGAYAWRIVLQSPLDSERCRLLVGFLVLRQYSRIFIHILCRSMISLSQK
jgi:hypothetical protein